MRTLHNHAMHCHDQYSNTYLKEIQLSYYSYAQIWFNRPILCGIHRLAGSPKGNLKEYFEDFWSDIFMGWMFLFTINKHQPFQCTVQKSYW